MPRRHSFQKRRGWHGDRDEQNRVDSGFEALILRQEDGSRRLLMFSEHDATKNLRDKTFPTLKAAKAYADDMFASHDIPVRLATPDPDPTPETARSNAMAKITFKKLEPGRYEVLADGHPLGAIERFKMNRYHSDVWYFEMSPTFTMRPESRLNNTSLNNLRAEVEQYTQRHEDDVRHWMKNKAEAAREQRAEFLVSFAKSIGNDPPEERTIRMTAPAPVQDAPAPMASPAPEDTRSDLEKSAALAAYPVACGCGADVGEPCVGRGGKAMKSMHGSRAFQVREGGAELRQRVIKERLGDAPQPDYNVMPKDIDGNPIFDTVEKPAEAQGATSVEVWNIHTGFTPSAAVVLDSSSAAVAAPERPHGQMGFDFGATLPETPTRSAPSRMGRKPRSRTGPSPYPSGGGRRRR